MLRPSGEPDGNLTPVPEPSADADQAGGIIPWGAESQRPDSWVAAAGVTPLAAAPGVSPLAGAPGAAAPFLSYSATLADVMAAVTDDPATLERYEKQVWKAGWRRGLRTLPFTLGLVLLANIFMLGLDLGWSVLSTVLLGGLFAVVTWSQVDHTVKRRLPAALERLARSELAEHGEQRRVVAEPTGVTLVDAAGSQHAGWHQVRLTETDRYVIVVAGPTRWAVPRTSGLQLASFVQFARRNGAR